MIELSKARQAREAAQGYADWIGLNVAIDEVAMIFESIDEMNNFTARAIRLAKATLLNEITVQDTMVNVGLVGNSFDICFNFIQIEPWWRIECMFLPYAGRSSLHSEVLRKEGSSGIVHASYKLPNWTAYLDHTRGVLGSAPVAYGGEFQNSYGQFCYNRYLGFPMWIKPRVNLRDAASASLT